MDLFENIRNKSFWLMHKLQGGKIKESYEEIKLFDNTSSEDAKLMKFQKDSLAKLLDHATKTTDFYADLSGKDFKEFPIINKNIIKEVQEKFLSSKFNKKDLFQMSTSGSTGTPFVCYQDSVKKIE